MNVNAQVRGVGNLPVDTVYAPKVIYSGMPDTYEIAGIKVTGVPNYEDYIVIGYGGINVGDRVEIPGPEITNAVKRLVRQGLFSSVKIIVEKTAGDRAWLEYALKPQPRISEINYHGVSKGEKKDLEERLQLMKGNQITPNIANRATQIIQNYYKQKGFGNATIKIDQVEDLSAPNENIVNINVDKHNKVKVHKIYIDGNEVMSDGAH